MRQDGITNSLLGESGYKVDRDSASLFLLSLILLFISVRSLIYCQNKNSLKQCFPTHWRPPASPRKLWGIYSIQNEYTTEHFS